MPQPSMVRTSQSSLDPNSADYYPQQYRGAGGGHMMGGGAYGNSSNVNSVLMNSPTTSGGAIMNNRNTNNNLGAGYGNSAYGGGGAQRGRHQEVSAMPMGSTINGTYYPNSSLISAGAGGGMFTMNSNSRNYNPNAVNGNATGGGMGGPRGGPAAAGGVHIVYSQHAVNHQHNGALSPQQIQGSYGAGGPVYAATHSSPSSLRDHVSDVGYGSVGRSNPRGIGDRNLAHVSPTRNTVAPTRSVDLLEQLATAAPTVSHSEWAGETPKVSPSAPEVPADQLQSIFEQLLAASTTPPPASIATDGFSSNLLASNPHSLKNNAPLEHTVNSKNTPSPGALERGAVAPKNQPNGPVNGADFDDLSNLIAHLPVDMPPSSAHPSTFTHSAHALNSKPRNSAAAAILRSPQRDTRTPLSMPASSSQSQTPSPSSRPVGTVGVGATVQQHGHGTALASPDASPHTVIGVGAKQQRCVSLELTEESPPIHISNISFVPTPEVSPQMAPSVKQSTISNVSPVMSGSVAPALPPPAILADQAAFPAVAPSLTGPKAVCLSPSPEFQDEETHSGSASEGSASKPNLASLLSANPTKLMGGPPPGSMAEKLLSGAKPLNAAVASSGAATPLKPASITASPAPSAPSARGTLPTTKAGIEKFLKDGDAPETLRHIKILAFSHDYPTEIKALFELWAGNGIPPPDDAFGAYYWYVRKKIGRDLCMKHNGPGKSPGVGYGGCDYASRGQGQCRYHHQCLFCTKEDHGWFDESKCGRYKTYQKELAKLKLTEDQIYEMVDSYCK